MDKDKLKELCRAFVHLNQAVSVALVELNFHSDLSEKDMEVRYEAFANITANLMAQIFKGENREEVMKLFYECKSEDFGFLDNIPSLMEDLKYPN